MPVRIVLLDSYKNRMKIYSTPIQSYSNLIDSYELLIDSYEYELLMKFL